MAVKPKNPAAVTLGRLGGRAKSEAKARAARRNAQRAGRKPKFVVGDRVRANDHAPGAYRKRRGKVTKKLAKSHYDVMFETETGDPATGVLMSWWLDRE